MALQIITFHVLTSSVNAIVMYIQEYANGYYDIKSLLTSDDLMTIAAENKATKKEIDAEEQKVKKQRKPVKVGMILNQDVYATLS